MPYSRKFRNIQNSEAFRSTFYKDFRFSGSQSHFAIAFGQKNGGSPDYMDALRCHSVVEYMGSSVVVEILFFLLIFDIRELMHPFYKTLKLGYSQHSFSKSVSHHLLISSRLRVFMTATIVVFKFTLFFHSN